MAAVATESGPPRSSTTERTCWRTSDGVSPPSTPPGWNAPGTWPLGPGASVAGVASTATPTRSVRFAVRSVSVRFAPRTQTVVVVSVTVTTRSNVRNRVAPDGRDGTGAEPVETVTARVVWLPRRSQPGPGGAAGSAGSAATCLVVACTRTSAL